MDDSFLLQLRDLLGDPAYEAWAMRNSTWIPGAPVATPVKAHDLACRLFMRTSFDESKLDGDDLQAYHELVGFRLLCALRGLRCSLLAASVTSRGDLYAQVLARTRNKERLQ